MKRLSAILCILLLVVATLAFADTQNVRGLSVFPNIVETIEIPATQAMLTWDDTNCLTIYDYTPKTQEQYCEGCPYEPKVSCIEQSEDPCIKEFKKVCKGKFGKPDPQPGHGNEPPWAHGGYSMDCFNVTEKIFCAKDAATCQDYVAATTETKETLVTVAKLEETINVRMTGFTWKTRNLQGRLIVRYFKPGKLAYVAAVVMPWTTLIDEIGEFKFEVPFTFTKPGTYAFRFAVKNLAGDLIGIIVSRTVVVLSPQ